MAWCKCPSCGKEFKSVSGFDGHRVGKYIPDTRRCLTENELKSKGWYKDNRGWWRMPGHKPERFRIFKISQEKTKLIPYHRLVKIMPQILK